MSITSKRRILKPEGKKRKVLISFRLTPELEAKAEGLVGPDTLNEWCRRVVVYKILELASPRKKEV